MTNTKGILIVSSGTCQEDTRRKTIDAIEQTIRLSYETIPVYHCWTSPRIIAKHFRTTGEKMPTVSDALSFMKQDGITQVYIQPTHISGGIENDRIQNEVDAFKNHFHSIFIGKPLISDSADVQKVLQIITGNFSTLPDTDAVIMMGHGSDHPSSIVFSELNTQLRNLHSHIFIGTLKCAPYLDDILTELSASPYKKIHLVPFMITAGNHVLRDMASEEVTSWKSVCQAAGYEVECHLTGLGEFPEIHQVFLSHLSQIM